MIYKTIITKPAELDIEEAVTYIKEKLFNPAAADRLLDNVVSAVNSLERMPQRHALLANDNLAALGFRMLPVEKYLLFYVIREDSNAVIIERFCMVAEIGGIFSILTFAKLILDNIF
jgi:toxin ParE1/3/4